jgi:polyisoprenoid-binding protein YceI
MTAETQPGTAIKTWQIDPMHTLVEFAVKHMMIATVKGRFAALSGTITMDEVNQERLSVEATIDVASIDTREPQRDGHLRSADFFDVERFPHMTFRSTRVERLDDNRARVFGDLTIRDVTREIALEVSLEGVQKDPWGNERAGFSAQTRLDRRDFGLGWNQALEAGGVLVGNEIRISLEVEAVKQG